MALASIPSGKEVASLGRSALPVPIPPSPSLLVTRSPGLCLLTLLAAALFGGPSWASSSLQENWSDGPRGLFVLTGPCRRGRDARHCDWLHCSFGTM